MKISNFSFWRQYKEFSLVQSLKFFSKFAIHLITCMLPFGSITSIVPLFILGFVYLIYFSASFLNKNKPESIKTDQEQNILFTAVDPDLKDCPDFRIQDDTGTDDYVVLSNDFHNNDLACALLYEIFSGELPSLTRVSQFLPRPPPSVR